MIRTSVASNIRKPGTTHEFDILSAARGLVPLTYNVLLIAMKTSAGTSVNGTIYQIFIDSDGDTYFGAGSELALMCRSALKVGRRVGSTPAIFAASMADPAGTAATRTLTVTGPATAAGDILIEVAGRPIRCGVKNGDAQNTIAANLKAAIDAVQVATPLPCTAGVATNVVTLTLRQTGVNGNELIQRVLEYPTGVAIALASPVAGVGAADITSTLDTSIDRYYHAIAVANHTSTDVTDFAAHITNMSLPQTKKWPLCFIAETAGLSTADTLGTTANNYQLVVVNAEKWPNMCGEIAAYHATLGFARTDPALPFDGDVVDLYLPEGIYVPTDTEIETAIAAGTTILTVLDGVTPTIVRMVTTKTTQGGAAFENALDFSNIRSLFYIAIQVDAQWRRWQANPQNKKNTQGARNRVRSVTLDVLHQAEDLEIVQNVDAHLGELIAETDLVVKTRVNVGIPVSVVPNLHQLSGVHTLFVEGAAA